MPVIALAAAALLVGSFAVLLVLSFGFSKRPSYISTPLQTYRPPNVGTISPPLADDLPSAAAPRSPGPMTLLPGSRVVEGVPVGYPHNIQGAVSAAANAVTSLESTLLLDRGAVIARIIAAPSYTDAIPDVVSGVENSRRQLGLAAEGADTALATQTLTPVAYQLLPTTPVATPVLILAAYVSTEADGTTGPSGFIPQRADMTWTVGDWHLLRPPALTDAEVTRLSVDPDTAAAAAVGWVDLHV